MHFVQVHNEYILWLDIAMNDVPLLHVDECKYYLSDDVAGLIVYEELLSFESLVQVSMLSIL